jgi:hypothetical protein
MGVVCCVSRLIGDEDSDTEGDGWEYFWKGVKISTWLIVVS